MNWHACIIIHNEITIDVFISSPGNIQLDNYIPTCLVIDEFNMSI
jgi:hypothetical protein